MFIFHDVFNPNVDEVRELKDQYRKGRVGDVKVKERLARALNDFLDPVRERRARFARQPALIDEIIREGTKRARAEAQETVAMAKKAMGLDEIFVDVCFRT